MSKIPNQGEGFFVFVEKIDEVFIYKKARDYIIEKYNSKDKISIFGIKRFPKYDEKDRYAYFISIHNQKVDKMKKKEKELKYIIEEFGKDNHKFDDMI